MFSRITSVVAVLVLLFGLAEFALGWAIGTGALGPYEQALARYSSMSSSGAVVNRATILIAIALVLGTLAEIGVAVRKAAR